MGLHLHHDRQLIRGPWEKIDRFGQRIGVPSDDLKGDKVTFFGGLEVMVEPRMWFTQGAPARLIEASDDRGQSLVPEAAGVEARHGDNALRISRHGGGVTEGADRVPPPAHGSIRPCCGCARRCPRDAPPSASRPTLIIPLAGAAGQTFRCDDAQFTFDTVKDSPTATDVAMTIQLNVDKADLPEKPDRELITTKAESDERHQLRRSPMPVGRYWPTRSAVAGSGGNTPSLYRPTLAPFRGPCDSALHTACSALVRSEAAFDFREVPLPLSRFSLFP